VHGAHFDGSRERSGRTQQHPCNRRQYVFLHWNVDDVSRQR
jgi:hypothetical protein